MSARQIPPEVEADIMTLDEVLHDRARGPDALGCEEWDRLKARLRAFSDPRMTDGEALEKEATAGLGDTLAAMDRLASIGRDDIRETDRVYRDMRAGLKRIREALAALRDLRSSEDAPEGEPVGWLVDGDFVPGLENSEEAWFGEAEEIVPLFTHPPVDAPEGPREPDGVVAGFVSRRGQWYAKVRLTDTERAGFPYAGGHAYFRAAPEEQESSEGCEPDDLWDDDDDEPDFSRAPHPSELGCPDDTCHGAGECLYDCTAPASEEGVGDD